MADESGEERMVRLKNEFRAIDTDDDGYITEGEFRAHFPALPAEALGALSQQADTDGDGRYSLEEFYRLMP